MLLLKDSFEPAPGRTFYAGLADRNGELLAVRQFLLHSDFHEIK
jgi:hypothetical protein